MPDDRPIRFAILGAARIAPKALIEPARRVTGVEIAAIAARDPARARAFADQHAIPRVFLNYAELIADPEIDAIYNPLPNSLHCEWTIRALQAGKHVLCEKPIASNAAEAERMAQVAEQEGLTLAEAFHYRYHPLAERVRTLLQTGTLGRLLHFDAQFRAPMAPTNIRFDWNLSGGATMDLGCYTVDMIRYFSGLPAQVRSARARVGPPNIDVAMEADLELADGLTARMGCSMAADVQPGASFTARGDRGELHVTNPIAPHSGHLLTVTTAHGDRQESIPGDTTFTYQLRALVAALRSNTPILTNAVEGIENMRVIDQIYRCAGLPPRGT